MTLIACCLCVCVYLHLLFILAMMSGFSLFLFLWNQWGLLSHKLSLPKWPVRLCPVKKTFSVFALCPSAVLGGLNRPRIWLILKKEKKHPLSIKLLNTLNSIMWLKLLVLHWVHRTLWAVFYESVALFNTTEHRGKTCDSNGWILCQGNQVEPHNCWF